MTRIAAAAPDPAVYQYAALVPEQFQIVAVFLVVVVFSLGVLVAVKI